MTKGCDHVIGVEHDDDGLLLHRSDADAWQVRDSAGSFKYCPLCGAELDWVSMLSDADAIITQRLQENAELAAAKLRESQANVERIRALLADPAANLSPETRMAFVVYVAGHDR